MWMIFILSASRTIGAPGAHPRDVTGFLSFPSGLVDATLSSIPLFPLHERREDKKGPSSGSRANTSNDLFWTGRGSDQEQEDVGQCRICRMRARLSPRRFLPSNWPLRSSLSSFPFYLGSSSMVQCPHEELWLWAGAAMAGCSPETMGSFSPVFHL